MEQEIQPINGAARYYAGYDPDKENKPCVCMVIAPDEHVNVNFYYVLSYHNSLEVARKAANKWQRKENKSVLKHHPELANAPITTY